MNELQEQIRVVAAARQEQKFLSDVKRQRLAEWESENKDLLHDISNNAEHLIDADALLRDMAIKVFNDTGNKTPAPGVGIREITRLDYDPQVAFLWATEHKVALKLDTPTFEKIAKASPPDFVKSLVVPQATIATDLSKYLTNE